MYATIAKILRRYFKGSSIFKYGFNLSPMYRRSTGRIRKVSDDLLEVKIEIPIGYKNRNYVGSIFGGSLFSATDPVFMIQLMHILGEEFVVWDKEGTIKFRRPARENSFASFIFTNEDIIKIKEEVQEKQEIDIVKDLNITNKEGTKVFAEVSKTIYIADKSYYKNKRKKK